MLRFVGVIALLLCGLCASAQEVRIHLAGDSTCADKELTKQNPERGWGQLFEPLFDESVKVINRATNGRSTRSFRAEGRWQQLLDAVQPGDYVLIQFGHNDQKIKDSTRYSSPEEYAANLRLFLREVRDHKATPVLLTSVVRRHFTDGRLDDTHAPYTAAVKSLAAAEHTLLLDLELLTRRWVESLGDEGSRPCYMQIAPGICPLYPDGRNDDTHLSVRGAHVVARLVADALAMAVPALAEHRLYPDYVVSQEGRGDFRTLAEGIAAIPDFCRDTTTLLVCEGTYREKITIPATKRNVQMSGRGEVRITYDDYASKCGATGHELGTSGSSTIYFGGENWTVQNLTFENSAGRVGQAVAVQCLATGLHFIGCRFLGNQDTLYLYGRGNCDGERVSDNARIRFDGCYVEGTTDFIFGSAAALFYDCEIRAKADSYLTAASTCRGQQVGLLFVACDLTADEGVTQCYLGRPWRDYAQTLLVDCRLGAHIRLEGWHDWSKPKARRRAFYAESGSVGAGASGKRVSWSKQISDRRAQRILEKFDR